MQKTEVIREITSYLEGERTEAEKAGDAERADEYKRLLLIYQYLPRRNYGEGDVIVPSALVELALGERRAFYFVAPQGGGLVTRVSGEPLQVITPNSPLGEALLGKKKGDEIDVESRGGSRHYRILNVS